MLAEPEGYIRIFVDEDIPMAQLLSEVAAHGIMPDYYFFQRGGNIKGWFWKKEAATEPRSWVWHTLQIYRMGVKC